MSRIETRPLQENLGTEVLNIDISGLDDETFGLVRQAWQRDPVLLFRRQSLTEEDLLVFSKRFGSLDLYTIKDINHLEKQFLEMIQVRGQRLRRMCA